MTLNKKIIYAFIILIVLASFIIGLYYWILLNPKEEEFAKQEFICPDITKLSYDEASKTYIKGADCMPHEGANYVGNPSYEKWVNKNCGIKFKYECATY